MWMNIPFSSVCLSFIQILKPHFLEILLEELKTNLFLHEYNLKKYNKVKKRNEQRFNDFKLHTYIQMVLSIKYLNPVCKQKQIFVSTL